MSTWCVSLLLVTVWFCLDTGDGWTKNKLKSAPRPEPDLKILELKVSPNPYAPSEGPLQFVVLLQLPKELDGATVLEVSSLVSLPSKTSLRFLSERKPVRALLDGLASSVSENGTGDSARSETGPRIQIVLPWDGKDQQLRVAPAGAYDYEVRAKLFSTGEKGSRTQMVSWPRRGTLVVK